MIGIFFFLISSLLALCSFIALFKPSLVRQASRIKAFSLCWIWSIAATLAGSTLDGKISLGEALAICAIIGFLYILCVAIAALIRWSRVPPESRVRQINELTAKQQKAISKLEADGERSINALFTYAANGIDRSATAATTAITRAQKKN